jgi:predicted transcriptional regulator
MQGVLRAAQVAGWTDETLAAASGVKPATIKGYRVEGKEPSLSKALSLAVVIGPAAINPIMALIGYAARPLDEADELQPTVLAASALAHLSVIATAAADGRIDHTELPACRDAADQLIATILPISSHGDAA